MQEITDIFKYFHLDWPKLSAVEQEVVFEAFAANGRNYLRTMCSGSGTAEFVHHICAAAAGSSSSTLRFSC